MFVTLGLLLLQEPLGRLGQRQHQSTCLSLVLDQVLLCSPLQAVKAAGPVSELAEDTAQSGGG